jgi:hypothetical protein
MKLNLYQKLATFINQIKDRPLCYAYFLVFNAGNPIKVVRINVI